MKANSIIKDELKLKRSSKLPHQLTTAHIITAEKFITKRYSEKVTIKQLHDYLN